MTSYEEFLTAKTAFVPSLGHDVDVDLNPVLKLHQAAICRWAIAGGRRAIFADFGLGKTVMAIQISVSLIDAYGGSALIICPLGVRQEFIRDAKRFFGIDIEYVRTNDEHAARVAAGGKYFVTNYERVRDGALDPNRFTVVSLDEAATLRSYGSKTFQTFLTLFEQVRFKFVATATPSPNRYKELIHYAGFLGIMQTGECLTRWFQRDSEKAGNLQLHPGKEREFWLWLSSWAVFLTRPSDLGFSDDGYDLPPLNVHEQRLASDHGAAGFDNHGQGKLLRDAALGLADAAREKRDTIGVRVERMALVASGIPSDEQFIVWVDLNDEQAAAERALDGIGVSYVSLYGSTDIEEREADLERWRRGEVRAFVSKPTMYGAGINMQQCCKEIFVGVSFKFADFIQAIARVHRFLQANPVDIHIIYTESEDAIYAELRRKWAQHNMLRDTMSRIIREYGLDGGLRQAELKRQMGCVRREAIGKSFVAVNNDNVLEMPRVADDSVDLVVTSWPFCYDEETQILTHRGWLGFADLRDDDEVATVHPDRLCLEWQRPTSRVWELYSGEMLAFGNRSFDLLVTPNHRLFVAGRSGFAPEKLTLVEANVVANKRNLRQWKTCLVPPRRGDGPKPERIMIPPLPADVLSGHGVELYWINAEDFMALAGWYLSEGHADSFTTGRSGGRLSIAQVTSEEKRKEIRELFLRIGLPPSMHSRQITVWCRNLAWFLIQEFGSGSKRKGIPRWVRDLHPDLLDILRDTMMKGDGTKDGLSYASYSADLRDHFQEICLKTGVRATIRGNIVNLGTAQLYPEIRRVERRSYTGMIGCVTVPNHRIIVRRNGKPCVSGNSDQYEYTPTFNDFGYNLGDAPFFAQMDYLTPEIVRALKPGRMYCVHAKDRIVFGSVSGDGMYTVNEFSDKCVAHLKKHGLRFMGRITIVTDVVRENNQTYRLGWSENAKDGTKMGCGMSEYVLLFRKLPSDPTRSYADEPVRHDKKRYTRARWQFDAHGLWRSSGDRFLSPDEIRGLDFQTLRKLWHEYNRTHVYNFAEHVQTAEALEAGGYLPSSFMLLDPVSHDPNVWDDVVRMRTLNGEQSRRQAVQHTCALQLDVVDRLIERYSNPGELVLDPFGGLGTVSYCAVKLGRRGYTIELSPEYHDDAVSYLRAAEADVPMPTLFETLAEDAAS